jgi:predicted MFS family arabinose efflux permease
MPDVVPTSTPPPTTTTASAPIDVEDEPLALDPPDPNVTPGDIERVGGFDSLKQPLFSKYLGTLALSMTGIWVRITAMGYLVYDLTDDPFKLGVVSFVQSAPQVLLSPLAGAYIDRVDRRKLLISIQITILLTMLITTYMIATGTITYGRLLIIAIIIGSMMTFDWPARLSILPKLVERKYLASAVALNSAVFNGAKVFGPALGGWLIAAVGMAWAFGYISLVAVPFIVVLVSMTHLRMERRTDGVNPPKPWKTLIEGYRYIWHHREIRAMLSVDLIPIVLGMSYISMAPAIARDVLHLDAGGLGLMLTFNGVGSLAGTLLVARFSSFARKRGMQVLVAIVTFSVSLIAFGLSSNVAFSFAVITVLGLAYAFSSTMNDTLIQLRVDDDYRGRVMSVYSTFWGFSPAGALLAGFLANHIGIQWAVAINGVLVLAYMPYLWLKTPMRGIE